MEVKRNIYMKFFEPLGTNVLHHIETSQLIWSDEEHWSLMD